MVPRILLILAFIAPQLAAPLPAGRGGPAPARDASCCCTTVETTTCCGETVREMRCGRTGGQCVCEAHGDEPAPAAPAPRTPERRTASTAFIAPLPALLSPARPAQARAPRSWSPAARSHAEAQALLCIWRT